VVIFAESVVTRPVLENARSSSQKIIHVAMPTDFPVPLGLKIFPVITTAMLNYRVDIRAKGGVQNVARLVYTSLVSPL
jgi:hypothetical protein